MAKPVALTNGRSWKTQSAAKAHFKEILNAHRDGERVVDPHAHSDLLALVERYDRDEPAATRKAGIGVDHFYRDRDQEHGGLTSCFYVRRVDGSAIDFSIYRAVEVASAP
jgi:hypothetical protein